MTTYDVYDDRETVSIGLSFDEVGVEVELAAREDFLKVCETLTRIGIASKREKRLWQSCHILHRRGRYRIIHFKEAFALDGRPSDFNEEDAARRNTIAALLAQWGLVRIVEPGFESWPRAGMSTIKVLAHREKREWVLEQKYQVGRKRTNPID